MWLFHCHIEYHVDIGMGIIIQVGDKSEFPKPPKNFPKCGSWSPSEDDDEDDDYDENQKQPILVQCINPPDNGAPRTGVFSVVLMAVMEGVVSTMVGFGSTVVKK